VDQGQFSDPDFISGTHQMENVQFIDKLVVMNVETFKSDVLAIIYRVFITCIWHHTDR